MERRILLVSADRAERGLLEPVMCELKKIGAAASWAELDSHKQPEENLACLRRILSTFTPDIVLVPTDRSEMVYVAAYAFHHGYVVAHFHAGNNATNHPDDINRRVISHFSHLLLCNMSEHKENLIRQGEEPWRIHVVGSTAFDNLSLDDSMTPSVPFDLVILHPDPSSAENTFNDLHETLRLIKNTYLVIWIYPNHDKNYEIIENFLLQNNRPYIFRQVAFTRNRFLSLLKNCRAAIGNSSCFYYELPLLNEKALFFQIGQRNRGLIVPPTTSGGSKRIATILSSVELTDKLKNKRWL